MKKILLVCLAFCLLTSNIDAKIWNPFGSVVTYNPGGHSWNNVKITQETIVVTYKKWITYEYSRFNELGCLERVFRLDQEISNKDGVRVEFIREVVLETDCDF